MSSTSPPEPGAAPEPRASTLTGTTPPDAGGVAPGRDIVLKPLPPGLWWVILGAVTAALGPLGGFLVGSIIGVGDPNAEVNPMFISLFVGILVGGVGILVAILGVLRLLRGRAQTHD